MNSRVVIIILNLILFIVTFVNVATIPATVLVESAPILFTSLITGLAGILLAFWVYMDGENIKALDAAIVQLEAKVVELTNKQGK